MDPGRKLNGRTARPKLGPIATALGTWALWTGRDLARGFWRWRRWSLPLTALFLIWCFALPRTLFADPTSTVVKSADGRLLGARIADDGQWRFPAGDSLPVRYQRCVLRFEDVHFRRHPGFNPVSIVKALAHNLTQDDRRGASTITQQVVRLSRKGRPRSYGEKLIEVFLATRLEWRLSKDEILALYAAHTPYGGNVVGLETASWRYFGLPPHQLSWGQTATLAVLPNAPALIFPGRNEARLKAKRDRLLRRLHADGAFDATTLELAVAEPLPGRPLPLPDRAPHFTEWIRSEHPGTQWTSSLDHELQLRVSALVARHHRELERNEIHNLAAVVVDVKDHKILAYVGNAPTGGEHAPYVDIVRRPRSTGSVLKPLLFARAFETGQLLPDALMPDIPTVINGYRPENFDRRFQGAVPAGRALARSLNVPAVRLLGEYGLDRFYRDLAGAGLHFPRPAAHYGLPFILGGAETSLLDVTRTYAALAARLDEHTEGAGGYRENAFPRLLTRAQETVDRGAVVPAVATFRADGIYAMFESLREVNRPAGDENWEFFTDARPIAWKTGTSFGFKDAWAVGTTPRHAIGVWAGNADGEGRPGLTGIKAAAPLLFAILEQLPDDDWFGKPSEELRIAEVCAESGFLRGPSCGQIRLMGVPKQGVRSPNCTHHRSFFTDATGAYRVNAACYPRATMVARTQFNLPTVMGYYYRKEHPGYPLIPPLLDGCAGPDEPLMEFIYPRKGEAVLLGRDFEGETGEVVFRLAHRGSAGRVHWYLDDRYLQTTETFHEIAVHPEPGTYTLSTVDDQGNRLAQQVEVRKASQSLWP